MRKTQYQPALTTLTKEEREQLADWLRQGTYDTVLERVNKPRAEGGFDLHISISPLQTFYAKVALLDLINTKVPDDKKMTITQFESISAGELLLAGDLNPQSAPLRRVVRSPQSDGVSSEVHNAIMETTRDLATSGDNTPTDLLALQRLADFPARADYREHKVQMDLERGAQKKEMDEHRKRMNEERLALAKRSLALREQQIAAGAEKSASSESAIRNPQSAMSDDLGPLASTLDEIEARATRKFNLPPPDRSSRGDEALEKAGTAESQLKDTTTPAPEHTLPAASAVKNSPGSPQPSLNGSAIQSSNNPSIPSMTGPSAPSVVNIESLEQRVSQYTLARHYEAAHGKNPLIVGKYAAWNFKTKMQWCPCGNKSLPCPDHGDFPKYFWQLSPDSADFTAVLRAKKLPFIPHYQLLREQEEAREFNPHSAIHAPTASSPHPAWNSANSPPP